MADPIWFRCQGCGEPACYFQSIVGHSKPIEMLGKSGTVPCLLYNTLPADTYWRLHQNAERIEPPTAFEPHRG